MKKILLGIAACLLAAAMTACSGESTSAASGSISAIEEQDFPDIKESAADNQISAEITSAAQQTKASDNFETSLVEQENTASLPDEIDNRENDDTAAIDEHGTYTSKDDVALYIHTYNKLPENFITKKEAEALGWPGGELEKYAPGKCIGGSYFGNYEKLLPTKNGREYHECDIDTLGAKSRGAKRIVYSNDGLIYYTEDHYESFELLYGEE